MNGDTLNLRFLHVPSAAIILSLILHGSAAFMMLTMHLIETWGIRIFPKRDYSKYLVQSYVQVDVVGLPDQLMSDQKFVDPAAPISEAVPTVPTKRISEIIEKDSSLEMKEKTSKAQAREREQVTALKKLEEEVRREQALQELVTQKGGKSSRARLSGNIVSKGTSTQGKIGANSEQYRSLITHLIKEHFNIFLWQKSKALMSVIKVRLDRKGAVVEKKLLKTSGDARYDAAVFLAIDETEPFPIPEDFSIVDEGITLEFRPED